MFFLLFSIFIFFKILFRLHGFFGLNSLIYLIGEKRPFSFKYIFVDVIDGLILFGLYYFILMHFTYLNVDSFDFYNLGAITTGLITVFFYINYFRIFFLFSSSIIKDDNIFLDNFYIDDKNFKIFTVPYILEKVLYIPFTNIVLVGQKLNLYVPTNHLKLLCKAETLFFNRVKFLKIFLFLFFLLIFISFLFLFKKYYMPFSNLAFNFFLFLFGFFYNLLNNKLNKIILSKVDLYIFKTYSHDFDEALTKLRTYIFFNMHLNKYNKIQKSITWRILNLSK